MARGICIRSMVLIFSVAFKMKDYDKRILDERTELITKIDKLKAFMTTDKFIEMDGYEKYLLTQQLIAMTDYQILLGMRLM